ncbi:unnamed protein product [Trichobilharzia regenti]|nr:unnamed protein product [Trichobilharzia regenti]
MATGRLMKKFKSFHFILNTALKMSSRKTMKALQLNQGAQRTLSIANQQVDDYNEVVEDFSSLLSPTADVRLDDPYVIYMGRNDTMQPADGFDGCIYAAQWNNIFPLHLAYEEPRSALVEMVPAVSYIGGGRPQRYSFQGCLRQIRINGIDVEWDKLDPSARHRSIINGSCMIQDRCNPNPCKHEAPCSQTGATFYCDCTNTGYAGAVCHQSEYFTSCSEAGLFYSLQQSTINITIDMDGSGVLKPIEVTCDFTDQNTVMTMLNHDAPGDIIVDGYQAPGSYRRKLNYGRADRDTLGELHVLSSLQCPINLHRMLKLFCGTTYENRAWGWWVSQEGRPQFYWGGGVPGLQKCACGVEGTCTGDSLTCNCDSDGSAAPPLVDTGLLQFKDHLPVMEVRFGDTGGINDNKRAAYRVGPLRCYGDKLFDNTVTFRKVDANLELPPLYSEFAFDMSFIFRTTITDAVIMQNNGRVSKQFFEVRIRSKQGFFCFFMVSFEFSTQNLH